MKFYAVCAGIGGVLGASILGLVFLIFCRFYLSKLLVIITIKNPEFLEILKTLIKEGIERVIGAFKVKIPLVGMFLGSGKELELKKIAVDELVGRAPDVDPKLFDAVALLIQRKAAPYAIAAGGGVGAFVGFAISIASRYFS